MIERERQGVTAWPSLDELLERKQNGWRLVALDWMRDVPAASTHDAEPGLQTGVEIPFGLRVSADGFHLEDDPAERRVLMMALSGIVDDRPISRVAADLNQAGFTTRDGRAWSAPAVFELLPRLIEASPSLFASRDWSDQREQHRQRA